MAALTDLDAGALSQAIHRRDVSCRDVMRATLARIHALNPRLNAIVSLASDDALLREADARDAQLARGSSMGFLHGIPLAIKDAAHVVGFPTTQGQRLLADALPAADGLMVSRMKAAGCIVVGKTNVPEFGLGSHTFNELFGATTNAWDAGVSAGGSSGGAAVCLAQRLLTLADGSDFMGSLRNPAGWNHVFGMRPSQGRVPPWPRRDVWITQLSTEGPMARSVHDLAQLLSIQAGYDARAPLAIADGPRSFAPPRDASARSLRVGWLADLGGHLPYEAGVADVCEAALARLERGGAVVEPVALGFDADALWQSWLAWRRALVAPNVAEAIARHPDGRRFVKPEALWEHDEARSLSVLDFIAASEVRTAFHAHCVSTLFQRYDVLALPAAQVWPFAIGERWPREIAGRTMDTYHRWMEVTIYATLAGAPAISVPAGFHANGRWPMGLQLIGRPGGDAELLAAAQAYENLVPDLLAVRPGEPS